MDCKTAWNLTSLESHPWIQQKLRYITPSNVAKPIHLEKTIIIHQLKTSEEPRKALPIIPVTSWRRSGSLRGNISWCCPPKFEHVSFVWVSVQFSISQIRKAKKWPLKPKRKSQIYTDKNILKSQLRWFYWGKCLIWVFFQFCLIGNAYPDAEWCWNIYQHLPKK